jgi:hypothetical protein
MAADTRSAWPAAASAGARINSSPSDHAALLHAGIAPSVSAGASSWPRHSATHCGSAGSRWLGQPLRFWGWSEEW